MWSRMYLKIKYLQDFLISFLLLPIVLILIGLHCCIHGVIYRSNPFFVSSRVGQHRKTFNLIKLKSMVDNTPFAATADLKRPENYITRYGKFLRKTSLDEVPQFFNVLRGEMTLVGPKPGLITQRELLELRSKCGLEGLRPGLTGLAQITYRDSASDRLKAKVDALYLKNAGFCLDIWILTRTLLQVFFPVNVHH